MHKLFHYTNFEALKGIVENKELWLTSSLSMNDPNDRQYASNCIKEMVDNNDHHHLSALKEHLSKDKINHLFDWYDKIPFYSVSFCKNDNPYLWKNYADNHTGIRITFDEEIFIKGINDYNAKFKNELSQDFHMLNFRKVIYGNGKDYIEKVYNDFKTLYSGGSKWYLLLEMIIFIVSGTIKDQTYSSENEYRLLFKNIYSERFLEYAPCISATYNQLQKENHQKIMDSLGLSKIIFAPKEHYALNIAQLLSSKFITEIVIGKNSIVDPDAIRNLLKVNGIDDIVVEKQMSK